MSSPRELREARYREWLAAQGLRFGFPAEVSALAQRTTRLVQNDTPPVEAWHRIMPTLRVVERLRERFGATTIHSAYRSPAYNLAVGGVGDSRHAQNDAIDCSCATGTPRAWAAFLRDLREGGVFAGGIGVYSGFVHVDTRGFAADWTGA